ncbi:MAG: Four helix bundle protein [Mucilaginibacter sp.]|nr:Four helix bundle protein [Mucilaginibacter sp.]
MDNSGRQGWLESPKACHYISKEVDDKLYALSDETGRIVQYMIDKPVSSAQDKLMELQTPYCKLPTVR